jgi:hypothetical protein
VTIEATINGEVLTCCEIPEEYLQDIDGASWQDNVAFREQVIAMHLEGFRKKMEKFFHPGFQVDYVLVFPSKMNNDEQIDDGSGEAASLPDRSPKKGDIGDAV